MRKVLALLLVSVIALMGAFAVSAQEAPQENLYGLTPSEAIANAAPQVPVEVATYLVNNPTFCGIRGENANLHAGLPKINFARNGGWGNSFRINVAAETFIVGGRGVAGNCRIPIANVPGATQIVMTELCGFRGDGVTPRVNTSNSDWGNGSRIREDGSLFITGLAVGGNCTLTGAEADLAFALIPKFNR